jgi:hypothetical protein
LATVLKSDDTKAEWQKHPTCLRPVHVVPNRVDAMWSHLATCKRVDDTTRTRAKGVCAQAGYIKQLADAQKDKQRCVLVSLPKILLIFQIRSRRGVSAHSSAASLNIDDNNPPPLVDDDMDDEQSRADFHPDTCRLFLELGAAWSGADRPFVRKYFQKHVTGRPALPSSGTLSGRVLDEESAKVVASWREETKDEYGSGQSDGWKNVQKRNLVTSVAVTNGKACRLSARL